LINQDAKGNIFKIAKQMVKKKDVVGTGCMKYVNGSIVVDNEKIWKSTMGSDE